MPICELIWLTEILCINNIELYYAVSRPLLYPWLRYKSISIMHCLRHIFRLKKYCHLNKFYYLSRKISYYEHSKIKIKIKIKNREIKWREVMIMSRKKGMTEPTSAELGQEFLAFMEFESMKNEYYHKQDSNLSDSPNPSSGLSSKQSSVQSSDSNCPSSINSNDLHTT